MLKDKRIHQSKIWQIMERRKDGKPLEFSIQFCKKSNGELVTYDRAVLTSFHSSGSTIIVLPCGEVTPKKIRRCLVTANLILEGYDTYAVLKGGNNVIKFSDNTDITTDKNTSAIEVTPKGKAAPIKFMQRGRNNNMPYDIMKKIGINVTV